MPDSLTIHPEENQLLDPGKKSLKLFQVKLFDKDTLQHKIPIFVLAESRERAILQVSCFHYESGTLTPLEEKAIAEWSETASSGFMIQGWSDRVFGTM